MALTRIDPPSISGDGWTAIRSGATVTLTLNGWRGEPFTLPSGWTPRLTTRGVAIDGTATPVRLYLSTSGEFRSLNTVSGSVWGQIVYAT